MVAQQPSSERRPFYKIPLNIPLAPDIPKIPTITYSAKSELFWSRAKPADLVLPGSLLYFIV